MTCHISRSIIAAVLVTLSLVVPPRFVQAQSPLDTITSSAAALPCIDCLWQGAWCQICRKLPLTIAPGGTDNVSETDLARLQISPWLARASRCMANPRLQKNGPEGPTDLTVIAQQTDDLQRMSRVQMCLEAEFEPTKGDYAPRWALSWDKPSRTLTIENTREDAETALVIVALSEVATGKSVEVTLDPGRAILPVKAGKAARVGLPHVEDLEGDFTLDIAVTSATRLTDDRTEQTVLQVHLSDQK